jgi:hypothetical protein
MAEALVNPKIIAVSAIMSAASSRGVIRHVVLTGGSDAASVVVYNGQDNTGVKLLTLKAAAGVSIALNPTAIPFTNGVYVAVTGTAPEVNIGIG